MNQCSTIGCDLLDDPSRRWQVVKLATGELVCREILDVAPPSTSELPAYR